MAKEFLSKATADNSVSRFLDRLEQTNDVCSHSLCQALHRSFHSLIVSYTVFSASPSASEEGTLAEESSLVLQKENESGRLWAEVALDFSWRKLNSNHWKDVELIWREVYATAALFKALSLLRAGQMQEALVEIDKGILLGAPVFGDILKKFAGTLTSEVKVAQQISKSQQDIDTNNFPLKGNSDLAQTNKCKPEARKVTFRNYISYCESPSSDKDLLLVRTYPRNGVESLFSVDPSTVPLIDMTRRIAVVNCPSLEEFYHNHMTCSTSVVISGAMDHWPACTTRKWRYTLGIILYTCKCTLPYFA